ncbi:TPA: NAD(P)-dependent oxidoreductase [Candidatus Micrarchaeota archaeon]|nr:NAD(P)-dependent oxidoreductase [Candidatus Micrarchaeota archaeon]
MVTLVIGGSGLVGYEFYRQSAGQEGWHFTYRSKKMDGFRQLDATDADAASAIIAELQPDVVIVPAAMAHVNRCETEPEMARLNNVGLIENVIAPMKKLGKGKLVFFSTDYLFDGRDGPYPEDAPFNPLNAYGRLKLDCEKAIAGSGLEHIIARTTGVFGWEMQRKNFLYRVMDTLSEGRELVIPEDQYATPTYVKDLVSAVNSLLEKGEGGVFNVSGPDYLNRVELASKMADAFSLDKSRIVGMPTSSFNNLAPRPLKAGLRIDKLTALGIMMRGVDESLEDMKRRKEEDDRYPLAEGQ